MVIDGKTSSWSPMASSVPQGSVLRSTLFMIFIKDIDEGIENEIVMFANDTRILKKVLCLE